VNFNLNFNVLLSKNIVNPLVKIKKKTLIISRCTVQLRKNGYICIELKLVSRFVTATLGRYFKMACSNHSLSMA
jgi:hypothetical protein